MKACAGGAPNPTILPSAGRMDDVSYRDLGRELSNWGRWGTDDELGTLNLVTPERRIAAARSSSSMCFSDSTRPRKSTTFSLRGSRFGV